MPVAITKRFCLQVNSQRSCITYDILILIMQFLSTENYFARLFGCVFESLNKIERSNDFGRGCLLIQYGLDQNGKFL